MNIKEIRLKVIIIEILTILFCLVLIFSSDGSGKAMHINISNVESVHIINRASTLPEGPLTYDTLINDESYTENYIQIADTQTIKTILEFYENITPSREYNVFTDALLGYDLKQEYIPKPQIFIETTDSLFHLNLDSYGHAVVRVRTLDKANLHLVDYNGKMFLQTSENEEQISDKLCTPPFDNYESIIVMIDNINKETINIEEFFEEVME